MITLSLHLKHHFNLSSFQKEMEIHHTNLGLSRGFFPDRLHIISDEYPRGVYFQFAQMYPNPDHSTESVEYVGNVGSYQCKITVLT